MSNDVAVWNLKLVSSTANLTFVLPRFVIDDGAIAAASGTECLISGWGTTEVGGSGTEVSPMQLVATVPISSPISCSNAYPKISPTSVCAGYDVGGVDTCQGDSGGPLFKESKAGVVLVGLTSYGYGCANKAFPGVYTRLSAQSVRTFLKPLIGM